MVHFSMFSIFLIARLLGDSLNKHSYFNFVLFFYFIRRAIDSPLGLF